MGENKILRDLENGVSPEITLPKYADVLAKSYYAMSCCKFGTNFTTYYDDLEKAGGLDHELTLDDFENLCTMLSVFITDGSSDESVAGLDQMRTALVCRMRKLYDYVHVLEIYEHVMNRIQHRFDDKVIPVKLENLMLEISQYFEQSKDPATVNRRIQDVYGEMPIRMTKSYFLDMVKTGCGYYKGTRNDIADYFFNDMYHQSTLYSADELSDAYGDLNSIVRHIESVDLADISEDELKKCMDMLEIAGQQLSQVFSYDFQLLELINDLYILMITESFSEKNSKVDQTMKRLVKAYMTAATEHNFIGMDENIIEDMNILNEEIENRTGLHMLFEDQLLPVCGKYSDVINNLGLGNMFDHLTCANKLSGIDLMASLKESNSYFIADADYIKAKTDILLDNYQQMMKTQPMIIRRAMIADALSKLPITSNSIDESKRLIQQNFENCKDDAERFACAKLIRTIISDKEW